MFVAAFVAAVSPLFISPVGPAQRRRPRVDFVARLASHGARAALVDSSERLTYAELADRVDAAASARSGSRHLVTMSLERTVTSVVEYLGCLAAGDPVILVNPCASSAVIDTYQPDQIIAGQAAHRQTSSQAHPTNLHPDLALLLSTSGSTGSPKLVRLSAGNVSANAAAVADYLGIRSDDTAITSLPLTYCYGLSVLHSHLHAGAAVVLTDMSVLEHQFWQLVADEGVTTIAGVPHTFDMLRRVSFADMDLPRLRYVTQAGGRMDPRALRDLVETGERRGFDVVVMYGQTEATARMAYLPPDLVAAHPDAVGVPIPGGSIRIVDGSAAHQQNGAGDTHDIPARCAGAGGCSSHEVPRGAVGELVYEGPNVMLGYAEGRADLALGRTVTHLHTGDLARLGEDGLLRIVGRVSRAAKVMGLRVDLDRVEAAMVSRGSPAACVSDDDELVVVVEANGSIDAAALAQHAADVCGLSPANVSVRSVPSLPRTSSGKIDYAQLGGPSHGDGSAPDNDPRAAAVAAGPDLSPDPGPNTRPHTRPETGDVHMAVRAAFADVLHRHPDSVSGHDSFSRLGGDSMTFVALSVRLERILGTLPAQWHRSSIDTLVGSASPTKRQRRLRHVDTSVPLRAMAILLVVGTHAGAFYLLGGAHLLMVLAGFSFARFRLGDVPFEERLRGIRRSVARIAVPTIIWFTALATLTSTYGLSLFTATTVIGPNESAPPWRYWFVEALVLLLVLMAVLFRSAVVDRLQRRHPVGLPLLLLAASLLVWAWVAEDAFPRSEISAPAVAWLFALGWFAASLQRGWQRWSLLAVMCLTIPLMYDDLSRALLVVGGLGAVMLLSTVPLPRLLVHVARPLAAASLFIYLTHFQVYPPLDGGWAGTLAGLAVGIAVWLGYERARGALLTRVGGGP